MIRKLFKKPDWYKTNKKEVFDYMVRYERFNFRQTGREGVYPGTGVIANVFDITLQRAYQYKKMFEEKLKNIED